MRNKCIPREKFSGISVLSILLLLSCQTSELKLKGITAKSEEFYFYGADFRVSANTLDDKALELIKLDLKSRLADTLPPDRIKQWEETGKISSADGFYLLFQVFPKSRILPEFLEFKFSLNENIPLRFYSYYAFQLNTNIRTYGRLYPYPYMPGGVYGGYYAYPYPLMPYDASISMEEQHCYRFLVLFPAGTIIKGKNIFKVKTPKGNFIEFEYELPK